MLYAITEQAVGKICAQSAVRSWYTSASTQYWAQLSKYDTERNRVAFLSSKDWDHPRPTGASIILGALGNKDLARGRWEVSTSGLCALEVTKRPWHLAKPGSFVWGCWGAFQKKDWENCGRWCGTWGRIVRSAGRGHTPEGFLNGVISFVDRLLERVGPYIMSASPWTVNA